MNADECGLAGNQNTGSLFCFSTQKGTHFETAVSGRNKILVIIMIALPKVDFLQVAKSDRSSQHTETAASLEHGELGTNVSPLGLNQQRSSGFSPREEAATAGAPRGP